MRRQLVTVRWPGASNAPINSTCACRQTRPENNGAKVFRRATNSGGKDSKQDHFLGHLHTTAPSRNGQSRAQEVQSSLDTLNLDLSRVVTQYSPAPSGRGFNGS